MAKDLIIDNVDVSDCEFLEYCNVNPENSECTAFYSSYPEGIFYENCNEHPNCPYKKWRKAEEKLDIIDGICTGVLEDYENQSIVMIGLAGKITDTISGVNNGK